MKMKRAFSLIGIFLLFLIIGIGFRSLWFFFVQKEILEYTYIEKPMREAKGGGKTPEETWIGYLEALEKGDIEKALTYIWPEERNEFKFLYDLKKNGLLYRYAKNNYKQLRPNLEVQQILEKNERAYYRTYLAEKDIEMFFVKDDPELIKAEEEYWASKKTDKELVEFTIIFKYNPYSKKWLIIRKI